MTTGAREREDRAPGRCIPVPEASLREPKAASAVDVGTFFDDRVDIYDGDYDLQGWGGHVLRMRLRTAVALIGDGPGELLDVGMGPGRLCEQLARRGWTVSGIDLSPEMVRRARARLPDAAERLRQGTIEALPFPEESFDAVTATGVFEYVEKPSIAVGELARVLRPAGLAILSIPNRGSWHASSRMLTDPPARLVKRVCFGGPPANARYARTPSRLEFERVLAEEGLRVDAVRSAGSLIIPAPFDRAVPRTSQRLAARLERRPRLRGVLATQLVIRAVKVRGAGRPSTGRHGSR
jgi:ubiquinone/menaquinone biosynthesis C-methylase UbiE